MKTEFLWKVFRVPGHVLEKKLNECSEEHLEVVSIEFVRGVWTIITRQSTHLHPKGNVIGFTAKKE